MFKPNLSEADFADYTWPEDELAGFHAYMTSNAPLFLTPQIVPPADAASKSAKEASFQDDADAVVRLGTVVSSFKRLGLAIRDRRCQNVWPGRASQDRLPRRRT
jgi:hypothetical protein